ncbi:hypothetical protein MDA_GLEAN10006746 [Myotis davidii]|uniref:Uncharacterized protein n=1 Tax=Myotis davidii TaxID=225400 RepID=L5LID5_MYODS|nr:hypothetical protein MDA_GLEAN10006746 [Myotis davidii]
MPRKQPSKALPTTACANSHEDSSLDSCSQIQPQVGLPAPGGLMLSAPCAEGKPATGKANSAKGPDTVSVLSPLSLFRTLVLQRQPTNPRGNQYRALPAE